MLHPQNTRRRAAAGIACLAALLASAAAVAADVPAAGAAASVYLEDLTSPELRERIAAGAATVLVPIGGTEQSGPHLALGKHNARARLLAGRIAQRLGDAVVAPVVAYVPEGSIAPPAGHMRFAGTLSIPDAAFEALLEGTARSLCAHGVRDVFFLGDHGGYQKNEERAAARANKALDSGCRVHALPDYYQATQDAYVADLKRRGYGDAEIGLHAGLADTSLSLALDPAQVRTGLLAAGARAGAAGGVRGDPTRASAALGQLGVARIVDASVAAIRAARQSGARQSGPVQKPSKQQ
ncbi:creatininase family protein [Massilia forsythiae]|uniref:Creatininase family protein n=1 Tax=Massilia forsythiae TaxID=2728020 RepID=A0A7Z2ZTR6_9BURK|nr:creatininase family protein [Massilia forsythiae]QJE01813.1 creatininase family protein [Massilia forsythiae]